MTVKKLNEQEVHIRVPNPNGTHRVDGYTQEQNEQYEVETTYYDNPADTEVYNASFYGYDWTNTWTVPETGVYYLRMDMDGGEQTSLGIKVDNTVVDSVPWDTSETVASSVRVLYAGSVVTFNAGYVRFNPNTYTVTVRKVTNTDETTFGTTNSNTPVVHREWPVRKPVIETRQI